MAAGAVVAEGFVSALDIPAATLAGRPYRIQTAPTEVVRQASGALNR